MRGSVITCDFAQVYDNQKVTLVGIFDQVTADTFPAMMVPFSIFVAILNEDGDELTPGDFKVNIDILDPKGAQLFGWIVNGRQERQGSPGEKIQLIVHATAITVNEPGAHRITLKYNDKEIAGTEIGVNKP